MTATVAKPKSCFASWHEREFNPILIKELRQGVRSRMLLGMFYFHLLLFFSISLYVIISRSAQPETAFRTGKDLFISCLGVLVVGCIVFIPLYTGIRVAWEKSRADLSFYTPLPVTKLVQGKLLSSLYLAGLFFSACLPFMMLGHLLRGIDWLTILFVSGVLGYATLIAILTTMALAVMPMPIIAKCLLGIGLASGLVLFASLLFAVLALMAASGAGAPVFNANFIAGCAVVVFISFFPIIVLYGLCESFIVPHRRPHLSQRSSLNPT